MQSASGIRVLRRGALALLAVVTAVSAAPVAVTSVQAKATPKVVTVATTRKPVNPGGGTKATTRKTVTTTVKTTTRKTTTKKGTRHTPDEYGAALDKLAALMRNASQSVQSHVTMVGEYARQLQAYLDRGSPEDMKGALITQSTAQSTYDATAGMDTPCKPEAIKDSDELAAIAADVVSASEALLFRERAGVALSALLETCIAVHETRQGFQLVANGDPSGALAAVETAPARLQRYQERFDDALASLRGWGPLGSLTK